MAENHSPETILQAALEISDLQERSAYLDEACGKDRALRHEIESLLAAHFAANSDFMDTLADPLLMEAPTEKEGDAIGRYKLLQQIGEGGFGTVYMAEQTKPVKRRVALKVIKAGMDTKEVIARFEAERQALALMDHPNIAHVYDAGTTEGGRPYFVMELVKGVPLTKYCAEKDLHTRDRLELFTDVCAAVQHAHQKGIIHRDLKPSNILVSPHDGKPVVKVIDFGIAKAIGMELTEKTVFTQLGRMIGTPQYMSPEQAELNALDVDTRSDIYSLGVVLYELLTGTTPLDGEKLRSAAYGEMQRMIREETPVKPSTRVNTVSLTGDTKGLPDSRALRGDLDWIVMKALEKERARRYETANALALDVGRHLRNEPVTAGPPSALYRLRKFARRHPVLLLSIVVFYLPIPLVLLASFWTASVEITNKIHDNLNLVTNIQRARVNEALDRHFERLEQISAQRPLQDNLVRFVEDSVSDSQDRVNAILRDAKWAAASYKEVTIISDEGLVIGSSNLDKIGASYKDRLFFKERTTPGGVIVNGGRGVSFQVDEEGKLSVVLSEPFKVEDGEELGLLVIVLDGADLAATVPYSGTSSLTTMLVRPQKNGGVVVLTPPEVARDVRGMGDAERKLSKSLPMVRAATGEEGFYPDAMDYRGESVLAATRYYPDLRLGFVAKLDRAEAFHGLRRIRNICLGVFGAAHVYLLIALAALLLVRRGGGRSIS